MRSAMRKKIRMRVGSFFYDFFASFTREKLQEQMKEIRTANENKTEWIDAACIERRIIWRINLSVATSTEKSYTLLN